MRLLIISFLFLSCSNSHNDLREATQEIRNKEYIRGVYDCSNMSYDLCIDLERKGYDCRIVTYKHETGYHAIVEVIQGSKVIYLDPTSKFLEIPKPKYKILNTWTPSQIHQASIMPYMIKKQMLDFKGHLK